MKIKLEIELECNDSALESFNKDFLSHHERLYNSKEKAEQALHENGYDNAVANDIEDLIYNYMYDVTNCNIKII